MMCLAEQSNWRLFGADVYRLQGNLAASSLYVYAKIVDPLNLNIHTTINHSEVSEKNIMLATF